MNHKKKFNHLTRSSAHRKAMLANMAVSLIMHKRISTTVAKAKALIRRSRERSPQSSSNIIEAGPFTYNTSTLRFYKNDVEIPLSAKENSMIKLFIDNVDHIFSKDMIYSVIWGETIIDENAIMVYVNRLRQKIEDDPSNPRYLITVRGLGYRFTVR